MIIDTDKLVGKAVMESKMSNDNESVTLAHNIINALYKFGYDDIDYDEIYSKLFSNLNIVDGRDDVGTIEYLSAYDSIDDCRDCEDVSINKSKHIGKSFTVVFEANEYDARFVKLVYVMSKTQIIVIEMGTDTFANTIKNDLEPRKIHPMTKYLLESVAKYVCDNLEDYEDYIYDGLSELDQKKVEKFKQDLLVCSKNTEKCQYVK